MTNRNFEFVTDTATMCIYDLAALKHRLSDDADWWSIAEDEVAEVNAGNIAFLNLGSDGRYSAEVTDQVASEPGVQVRLNCPSGRLFLGSAEEVTGDDLEPEALRGGGFLDVPPGRYLLTASRVGSHVTLHLCADLGDRGRQYNDFKGPVRI